MNSVSKSIFRANSLNEDHFSTIDNLFSFYRTNGQVLDSAQIYFVSDSNHFEVIAYMPEDDSLNSKWDNKYVSRAKEQLKENNIESSVVLLSNPNIQNINPIISSDFKKGVLILEVDPFEIKSPISHSLDSELKNIPLYYLAKTYQGESYYDLISWESNYKSLARLYMNGYNDVFFRKELTEPDSLLCSNATKICQQLEKNTGLKCFFRINLNYLDEEKQESYINKYFKITDKSELYSYISEEYRLVM